MEKADVLEMTVHYLRERKRMEQKHQGTFIYIFYSFWSLWRIEIVYFIFVINRVSAIVKEMIYYQIFICQIPGESCFQSEIQL